MSKNIFSTVLSLFFFFGVFAQNEIKVVKIEDLKKVYVRPVDTTYVVNFFATWCGPCMMEMPVLNNFYKTHKNTNIQLIFVSLDNAGAYKKLPAKMKKLGVEAPVYLLNESSDYSWLPYIDKRWQGSIPATMIINTKKNVKAFFETPMDKGQLEFYLKKLGL
ncbi:MAG TPA: TlpA disulfide reductase family protein [Chitinophagales bacterium]|nr:TlpA disulfide reductase family protein [Chitinophagales bacterium]HPH88388.1 TlpA disulfide reductase family protein [Chitinophagales bacterium]